VNLEATFALLEPKRALRRFALSPERRPGFVHHGLGHKQFL